MNVIYIGIPPRISSAAASYYIQVEGEAVFVTSDINFGTTMLMIAPVPIPPHYRDFAGGSTQTLPLRMQLDDNMNAIHQELWRNEAGSTVPMARSEFEHRRKAGDNVHLTDSSTASVAGRARVLPGKEGVGEPPAVVPKPLALEGNQSATSDGAIRR